jgi:hypothetical protein
MAIYKNTPPIVTNGLIVNLDAANILSYVSGSTTWGDLSGNSYNMSLINSPTYTTNKYFNFDGTNQYGNFNYVGVRMTPSDDRTLEIWARVNSYPGVQGGLLADQKNTTGALMVLANGKFSWYWDDSLGVQSTATLTLNTWYQIVVVLRNSYYSTYYVNGALDLPEFRTSDTAAGQVTSWSIGRQNRDFTGEFFYLNCDVAIHRQYNKLLSDQEILQNYNSTKSRFNLS